MLRVSLKHFVTSKTGYSLAVSYYSGNLWDSTEKALYKTRQYPDIEKKKWNRAKKPRYLIIISLFLVQKTTLKSRFKY